MGDLRIAGARVSAGSDAPCFASRTVFWDTTQWGRASDFGVSGNELSAASFVRWCQFLRH